MLLEYIIQAKIVILSVLISGRGICFHLFSLVFTCFHLFSPNQDDSSSSVFRLSIFILSGERPSDMSTHMLSFINNCDLNGSRGCLGTFWKWGNQTLHFSYTTASYPTVHVFPSQPSRALALKNNQQWVTTDQRFSKKRTTCEYIHGNITPINRIWLCVEVAIQEEFLLILGMFTKTFFVATTFLVSRQQTRTWTHNGL